MPCDTLHVNVQDAMQDRILAGELLRKEPARFDDSSAHRLAGTKRGDDHVFDVLKKARKSKFGKTSPPTGRDGDGEACRIYGSMDVNKVQGDFHITAKGHGYWEGGAHVDHHSIIYTPYGCGRRDES